MGGAKLSMLLLLILTVLFCGLAAMLPLAWIGADALESSYREYAVRDMTANANLFALSLGRTSGSAGSSDMTALARDDGMISETRFTVVAADGTVLADSVEDAGRMENHANRPEIKTALSGNTGVDIRQSPTMGSEWIYVAIPFRDGSVVRAAASLDDLNSRLWVWWKRALLGCGASLALLLLLAILVARALSKPIEDAAAGADRYAKGDLSHRVPPSGSSEMRTLTESLNVMAAELEARFALISRQREEMYIVFDNMSEGVMAIDSDGKIMFLNLEAENILRLGNVVSGSPVEAAVRNAEMLDVIHEAAGANENLERDVRVADGENKETLVHVHTAPIRKRGESNGIVAIFRDVTQLRRLEIMRRDFIANVSHELRTPVTAVQSCLETVLDEAGGNAEKTTEFLEIALRNTRRLGSIIANLLFLAGMESDSNKEAEGIARHALRPVLDEALSQCAESAKERSAVFDVSCPDELVALMNPAMVVHAVVNLVDNAIKYGPEQGSIGIAARRNGDRVEIAVSDKGPGIAPRHYSRIFERFYRIDGVTRLKKGSGLGLALAKHIALAQGGDIRLESEIGAGSTFTLSLPHG